MSSVEAIELKAHAAWEGGDHRRALKLFQQGADAGSVGCMLDLGYLYDLGIGCRPDKAMAMRWYKQAYRHGDSAGASNVALLYKEQEKHRLAFAWYERSAALGDGDASLELGKLYLAGCGVRHSIPSARACLRAAQSAELVTEASREEAREIMQRLG